MFCSAGSLSISEAVITSALVAVCIQFISFLVAVTLSQLLWYHASLFMPSFLLYLLSLIWHFWLLQLFYCLCLSAVLGFCNPLYAMSFSYGCWDSLSAPCILGWPVWLCLACWDIMSGFPALWLAIANWCLLGCICCKLVHDWWLFIICTMMGF